MKLYVTGFPGNWDESKIDKIFSPYGADQIKILKSRQGMPFALVDIPDDNAAHRAIREKGGHFIDKNRRNRLLVKKDQGQFGKRGKKQNYKGGQNNDRHFPYRFVPRTPGSRMPRVSHISPGKGRVDIAFEINWKAIFPVVANPCRDSKVPESFPPSAKNEFSGFDKRWLMIDGRPVISPFTVKSAVAEAVANLLGSCYRVVDRASGHADAGKGTYPYDGAYKRYRVAMDKSTPGIISKIEILENKDREIEITPVTEYFYDQEASPEGISFSPGATYYIKFENKKHKKIIIEISSSRKGRCTIPVIYHGCYKFGMDNSLRGGQLGKKHYHRFYSPEDQILTGVLPAYHFESRDSLKKRVYMGEFTPLDRNDPRNSSSYKGEPWHQDLSRLAAGNFIYFEQFGGRVEAIGKNFQFKTIFKHEQTVPHGQARCTDPKNLCPRCRLFGMTGSDDGDAAGYKGRFKASGLTASCRLREDVFNAKIPLDLDGKYQVAEMRKWIDESGEICLKQFFFPILGQPKPSKRDVDGYFDSVTGRLKGVKQYVHAGAECKSLEKLEHLINKVNAGNDSHRIRSYGVACREGLEFSGTVGVEAADADEAAALIMALSHEHSGHAFKIGLGKSLGLGSMTSEIRAVWIRKPGAFEWERSDSGDFVTFMERAVPGVKKALDVHDRVKAFLNRFDIKRAENVKTGWPDAGWKYWKNANVKKTGLTP